VKSTAKNHIENITWNEQHIEHITWNDQHIATIIRSHFLPDVISV
jgi:hypothetical protein